jgi:serine/threonine-protein kinase
MHALWRASMADISTYEPLWGSWRVGELLGEGSIGKVYHVTREEYGRTSHAAVKIISIPQNESALKSLKEEFSDDEAVENYCQAQVNDIESKIDMVINFPAHNNIVGIQDYFVSPSYGGLGFDVLVRMEHLTSLADYASREPLSAIMVAKIGEDVCRALELCNLFRIIHRDIKPENIFLTSRGDIKLSDFYKARQLERTMSGVSKKATHSYMAPEAYNNLEYDSSVDTYSLGIVMYYCLNKGRGPFFPPAPAPVSSAAKKEAIAKRINGEPLPPLEGVDSGLFKIITRAAAFDKDSRYEGATAMREALAAYVKGKSKYTQEAVEFTGIEKAKKGSKGKSPSTLPPKMPERVSPVSARSRYVQYENQQPDFRVKFHNTVINLSTAILVTIIIVMFIKFLNLDKEIYKIASPYLPTIASFFTNIWDKILGFIS